MTQALYLRSAFPTGESPRTLTFHVTLLDQLHNWWRDPGWLTFQSAIDWVWAIHHFPPTVTHHFKTSRLWSDAVTSHDTTPIAPRTPSKKFTPIPNRETAGNSLSPSQCSCLCSFMQAHKGKQPFPLQVSLSRRHWSTLHHFGPPVNLSHFPKNIITSNKMFEQNPAGRTG